eukprot:CAMPEP_0197530396 /NCGR_PEP_ID=MMETSP1318-20131121/31714_1 /TAXON_ID=552666 /ORGANISM="Partenskyella glossopodia, Strain RCC365" /LENGTH=59 /DNA_ID=CAMNT_0043086209 /DNA_START=101 /DNA_END=280 /DNA_ORIENTATION=-
MNRMKAAYDAHKSGSKSKSTTSSRDNTPLPETTAKKRKNSGGGGLKQTKLNLKKKSKTE